MDVLLRRLVAYASLAAGLFGALLALFACAVALVAGAGLNPAEVLGITVGAGLASALLARFLIRRIPWFWVASEAARRVSGRRRRGGRDGPG